jgi:hypothetical protein
MESHLMTKYSETVDIKKLLVLGKIPQELLENYAAFGADIKVKIGGFCKSLYS